MFVRATTSFIGPIEFGSWYEAHLLPAVGERDLSTAKLFSQSSSPELVLGEFFLDQANSTIQTQPQESGTPHGAPARLQVALFSPLGVQLDTTTIPVIMDALTGLSWLSTQGQVEVTGGFTQADRIVLASIDTSVLASLPLTTIAGGLASIALSAFPKTPPIDFLAEAEELLLSGSGSVTRPSGTAGVYAYGARWEVVLAPLGLGKTDGATTLYEQRIAQWVVVKNRLGGGLYASETVEAYYEAGEMSWGIPFPVRIDYAILPFVTIRWRWLVFLQPPAGP